jgi:hypothetical protein
MLVSSPGSVRIERRDLTAQKLSSGRPRGRPPVAADLPIPLAEEFAYGLRLIVAGLEQLHG